MASGSPSKVSNQRTLRDIFTVIFRHKGRMFVFAAAVIAAVTTATLLAPDIYRSDAKILVRLGRESVSLDPTVSGATNSVISVGQARDAEIQSEIEILTSREIFGIVVDTFGPEAILTPHPGRKKTLGFLDRILDRILGRSETDPKDPEADRAADVEAAVKALSENLTVEVNAKSNIIDLSYEGYSPEITRQILEKIIDIYLDRHIAVHQVSRSLTFFQDQAEKLNQLRKEHENRLTELRLASGIGDPKDTEAVLMKRISDLKTQIIETEYNLAESEKTLEQLKSQLDEMPPEVLTERKTGIADQAVGNLRQRLFELRIKEQRLADQYKDGAEPLETVRRQIAEAEAMLAKEKGTRSEQVYGVNRVYEQILAAHLREEARYKGLTAKLEALNRSYAQEDKRFREVLGLAVEVARLETELKIQEENYRKYADKSEQARISQALETERFSNISIVQNPTRPVKPIRPKRKMNLLLGFLLALMGGIGLAYVSEFLDRTIKDPHQAENVLGVPVLAALPEIAPPRKP